jgi:tetratricopeptide (TPR) repeat protein
MASPDQRTSLGLLALLIPPVILTGLAFLTLARFNASDAPVGTPLAIAPTAVVDESSLALTHYQQGVDYHIQGQYPQAELAFKAALAVDPTLAVAYNALGNLYLDLERPSEALMMFGQAVQAEPEVAEWWRNLGVVRANQGYLTEAVAALETAVSLDPSSAAINDELTLIHAQLRGE